MEFISIGGLHPGLTTEDILNGMSLTRNRRLAEIFHRLRLADPYGTGLRRIFAFYRNCPVRPRIIVTANSFKLILPNQNAFPEEHGEAPADQADKRRLTAQEARVLEYLGEHGRMNEEELQELLGIRKTRCWVLTRKMAQEGLIEIEGRGPGKRFRLRA